MTEKDVGGTTTATTMVPQCNPDGLVFCPMLTLGGSGRAELRRGNDEKGHDWTRRGWRSPKRSVPTKRPPKIDSYSEEMVMREDIELQKWGSRPYGKFVPSPEMENGTKPEYPPRSDPRFSESHNGRAAASSEAKQEKQQFASTNDRAFLMHNLLSPVECRNLVGAAEPHLEPLDKYFVENYRAGSRALLMVPKVADSLYRRLARKLEPQDYQDRIPLCFGQSGVWIPLKLNECFKILKYEPPKFSDDVEQEEFLAHRDGPWVPREDQASIYTVLFYLTEGFVEGQTELSAQPPPNCRARSLRFHDEATYVVPVTGSALFFNHDLYHAGRALSSESKGAKWVAKTELIMQRVHSYHVDRYYFLESESGRSSNTGSGGAHAYQKMKEIYKASQNAMRRGEKEQFVELYQEVVSMQRAAMMETQERRYMAAQRKKQKDDNNDEETSSVSLFHSHGHFISAKLNADVLGDILGFLTAAEVVAMLPVSQGAYFSLLQSNTWRLRLEAEFPEVVRFGDPSEGFFASPSSRAAGAMTDNETMLRRILFGKGEATTTGPQELKQEARPLQSPPEYVEAVKATIFQQACNSSAASREEKPRKKTGSLPPRSGVSSGAFDWYALYLQRHALRHRFLPFGFWPRRDKPPLLLKDRSVTRSGMFSRSRGGKLPRFYDVINEKRNVGNGEPILGKRFAVLEIPGWFQDPTFFSPSHYSQEEVCRVQVGYHRTNPDNGTSGDDDVFDDEKKGICTIWHPYGGGGGGEDTERTSVVQRGGDESWECQDIEWSAFRGSLMHSVDTAFHPMLLLGLPQWWIEDSPGQKRLFSNLQDCFELLRVPAIRVVHPAVAAVVGHLVDPASGRTAHRKREELPNPAAAFMGVVSVSLEEEKILYLTIVDTVDLTVLKSVPLVCPGEIAAHELLDVSAYNKASDSGPKKRGGSLTHDGHIPVLYQNIDLSDAAWSTFVAAEVRKVGSNTPSFATEEVTMLGLREMMGRLDFRENCLFRPVA